MRALHAVLAVVVFAAVVITLAFVLPDGFGAFEPTESPCADVGGVGFWHDGWDANTIRVTYGISGSANALLVASVNGSVVGVLNVDRSGDIAADGRPMRLRRNLTGERTVRLALYADANGNDGFDPATDTACGGQATVTHNFSAS